MRPDVLLMDEPTAGLDDHGAARLLATLKKLKPPEQHWFSPLTMSISLMASLMTWPCSAAGRFWRRERRADFSPTGLC